MPSLRTMFGWLPCLLLAGITCSLALAPAGIRGVAVAAPAPAATLAGDPADVQAVRLVCTRCHAAGMFLNSPRTWARWTEVFQRMTKRGANPTPEQVDHILRYFLENLTIVNVNRSPPDELAPVLGVSDQVADAIASRRARTPFRTMDELARVKGVNRVILQQRRSRILF